MQKSVRVGFTKKCVQVSSSQESQIICVTNFERESDTESDVMDSLWAIPLDIQVIQNPEYSTLLHALPSIYIEHWCNYQLSPI